MAPSVVPDLPRVPLPSDLSQVVNEQFCYLAAVNLDHTATPEEATKWLEVVSILLELFSKK